MLQNSNMNGPLPRPPQLTPIRNDPLPLTTRHSVSAYWWKKQQLSVSPQSAQDFAKRLTDTGAEAVFKASDLDGNGDLNLEEFSLAIADQGQKFSQFEVCLLLRGGREYS